MNIFDIIVTYRGMFITGIKVTLLLTVVMLIGGMLVGSIMAFGLTIKSKNPAVKLLKIVIRIYIEIFRGSPLLIQLFFGYFGIAYLGIDISAYEACCIVLVLYAGAYICEILRSGLESIPKGQFEAGYCIGLGYFDVMRYIIFPQAVKIFLPTLVGFFISAIKDTCIVSLIGCTDFIKQSQVVINRTGAAIQVYIFVAVVFFIICYPLSLYVKKLENRRNRT